MGTRRMGIGRQIVKRQGLISAAAGSLHSFTRLVLFSSLLLGGCSESSTHGVVHGTVTLDDQPLVEGTVQFVPVDGASQTAAAMIKDGSFLATVPLGPMRVEFSAPKVVGRRKMYDEANSPEVDVVAELLPPRYNVQSKLAIDVQTGAQDAIYELSSQ